MIWVQAGGGDSVRLGVELVRAIRERRRDIRLALTFHEERPGDLKMLAGLGKVGIGWGARGARAVQRAMKRLSPLGVISVSPHPLPPGTRAIAFHIPPMGDFEAAYPGSPEEEAAWRRSGRAKYVAPPAQVRTLLIPGQVEPTLKALLGGDIFWLHGLAPNIRAWRASPLARRSLLLVSGIRIPLPPMERRRYPPGSVLSVEAPWFPAVAAASSGSHIHDEGHWALWHALAGGGPVDSGKIPFSRILARWEGYQADPHLARARGDEGRRSFWQERQRAASQIEALLERIWAW